MAPATPSFKTHWQVHVIPGEGVVFQAEQTARALRGAVYELVVPLIDGRTSVDDIVGALAGQVDPVTILHALARLELGGYVTDSKADVPAPAGAFWHGIGLDPVEALAALERSTVAVRTVGDVDLAPV